MQSFKRFAIYAAKIASAPQRPLVILLAAMLPIVATGSADPVVPVLVAQAPKPKPKPTPRPAPKGDETDPPVPLPDPQPDPQPFVPNPDVPVPTSPARAVITLWNDKPVPKTWPVGIPLVLSSTKSESGPLRDSVRWDIEPSWIDQSAGRSRDNREVTVGTGTKPGRKLTITLLVAKSDTLDLEKIEVETIPNPDEPDAPAPPKPDDPAPKPDDPKPPKPDDPAPPAPDPVLSARAKIFYDMIKANVDMKVAANVTMARKLGKVYTTMSGNISKAVAGVPPQGFTDLKNPDNIIMETSKLVVAALGSDLPTWQNFFAAIGKHINSVQRTELPDAGSHIEMWDDIAAAFAAF